MDTSRSGDLLPRFAVTLPGYKERWNQSFESGIKHLLNIIIHEFHNFQFVDINYQNFNFLGGLVFSQTLAAAGLSAGFLFLPLLFDTGADTFFCGGATAPTAASTVGSGWIFPPAVVVSPSLVPPLTCESSKTSASFSVKSLAGLTGVAEREEASKDLLRRLDSCVSGD